MCTECFTTEYYKFNSYDEFEKFCVVLDSKLTKTIDYFNQDTYKKDIHIIYKCNCCQQNWWLSEADNHWRGYFLKEENAKIFIDKDATKGYALKIGVLLVLFFLLIMIVKLIF